MNLFEDPNSQNTPAPENEPDGWNPENDPSTRLAAEIPADNNVISTPVGLNANPIGISPESQEDSVRLSAELPPVTGGMSPENPAEAEPGASLTEGEEPELTEDVTIPENSRVDFPPESATNETPPVEPPPAELFEPAPEEVSPSTPDAENYPPEKPVDGDGLTGPVAEETTGFPPPQTFSEEKPEFSNPENTFSDRIFINILEDKPASDAELTGPAAAASTGGSSVESSGPEIPYTEETFSSQGDGVSLPESPAASGAPFDNFDRPPLPDMSDLLPEWISEPEEQPSGTGPMAENNSRPTLPVQVGLEGIDGIIPVENITPILRPRISNLSDKLELTEEQESDISILNRINSTERQYESRPGKTNRSQQWLLRLLLGTGLILLIVFFLFTGIRIFPTPEVFAPSAVSFYSIINSLTEDAPVLLAMDFEPAFSGEIQTAALPVLQVLMQKKARLGVISSLPSGPILAQNLIDRAHENVPAWQPDKKLSILGWLPGNTTGLQSFAANPHAYDNFLTGKGSGWDKPAMVGINRLQDFRLVIIVSEDADVSRAWIEQVQPYLGDVRMLALSSSQAGPLLEAYYESGQIKGLLSGLPGAVMIEKFEKQSGFAGKFWDSYAIGILSAVIIIFLGIFLKRSKPKQNRKRKGGR